MGAMASQITSLAIIYSTVYSDADQRKHQSSASLAFVRGIHRGPVNSPHKWPVTWKMFPFDDVIMTIRLWVRWVAMAINTRGYCQAITFMYMKLYIYIQYAPRITFKSNVFLWFGACQFNKHNSVCCNTPGQSYNVASAGEADISNTGRRATWVHKELVIESQ